MAKGSVATFSNLLCKSNSALVSGGCLCVRDNGIFGAFASTIQYNLAGSGAGFWIGAQGAILDIGSVIALNLATEEGGGILTYGGTILALSTQVINNTALRGGGLMAYGVSPSTSIVDAVFTYVCWFLGIFQYI